MQLPRRTPAAFLWCALLLIAPLAAQQSNYPPVMSATRDVVYKNASGVDLKLWIYEPAGHTPSASRAAVVFYFGGGWQSGTPKQFEPHCQYLARRGMVCIAADYRVLRRNDTKISFAIKDAKSAMRFVRAHAAEWGIDPGRIAAGGGSAGGHLAAAVALLPGLNDPADDLSVSERPNALALFNPALIMAAVNGHRSAADPGLVRRRDRIDVPERDVSPYHHVTAGLPPAIIFHGTDDTTVPYWTAELFCEKMHRYGNRCELKPYEGKTHGFFNAGRDGGRAFDETVRQMDAFFVSLGYLPGPAGALTGD